MERGRSTAGVHMLLCCAYTGAQSGVDARSVYRKLRERNCEATPQHWQHRVVAPSDSFRAAIADVAFHILGLRLAARTGVANASWHATERPQTLCIVGRWNLFVGTLVLPPLMNVPALKILP